jgi:hypothetical protein
MSYFQILKGLIALLQDLLLDIAMYLSGKFNWYDPQLYSDEPKRTIVLKIGGLRLIIFLILLNIICIGSSFIFCGSIWGFSTSTFLLISLWAQFSDPI